jgi:hypothetical protein
MMKTIGPTTVLLFAMVLLVGANTFDHSHGQWDNLLQKHVSWISNGSASQVDYAGLKSDQMILNDYLENLSSVPITTFDKWSRNQQLAFLINAYNAFTIRLILDNYPGITSIRDTGSLFTSPWKKEFFRLLDEQHHLDWIEHKMIRGSGRYDEPLIHFAVNCASIGCPALLNEAFVAERIDEQLLDVTRRFLTDRSRNFFDGNNDSLNISSIFDWYEEDFEKGWRGYNSLKTFFAQHAEWLSDNDATRMKIQQGKFKINFLDYDWRLNIK